MEHPSIEITYDPTIKVRGITEELFKQQPEGKFVLKPFTIISKKVYKNFTDRSHAFNYLLKFLKKKSKEDNNVILNVFSEPRVVKRNFFISVLVDSIKIFKVMVSLYGEVLAKPFRFISDIKFWLDAEGTFNDILSKAEKKKLLIFQFDRLFFALLAFSFGSIIFPKIILTLNPAYDPPISFLSSIYPVSIWLILLVVYIIYTVITYRITKVSPLYIDEMLDIRFILKKVIYTITKIKKHINRKTVLIINFNIDFHFDSTTSSNLTKYLLNRACENGNINIIFHSQDSDYINSIKMRLTANQFGSAILLLENDDGIQEFEFIDNNEIDDENLPLSYREYEWYKQREEFQKRNQQLERENKEQLARFIQSAKLDSMSIATSGLAHEIRNPLSIIQLVIENLRTGKNLNQEVLIEKLNKIQTQVSRIFKLTETFQKFSSDRNLTKKSIDRQLTDSLSFFEQRLLSYKIEVNYEKPEKSIGEIEFSEEFSIVIENLISNSIDALSESKDAIIRIKMALEGNKLLLVFSDNGHGISEEDRNKIFTPLFTTKGPGKGTGLGLWLCYTIVKENLKGDIRVDSELNQGTSFTISLPVGGDENVQ